MEQSTSTKCIIRPVRDADLRSYRALRLEALAAHPEVFGSDYAEQSSDPESVWAGRIRTSMEGEFARIFLAEAPDGLIGMTAVYRDRGVKVQHSANIVSVYVRPACRGRGLAKALVEEALEWSASVGVRIARLSVVTTNATAIRCYLRCGFQVCGVQPEVHRVGETFHDELLMWRRV